MRREEGVGKALRRELDRTKREVKKREGKQEKEKRKGEERNTNLSPSAAPEFMNMNKLDPTVGDAATALGNVQVTARGRQG